MFNRHSILANRQSLHGMSAGGVGFTLVELLVVIAIISLLAAILIPTLNKAKDSAKQVVCMSNLRQVGIAVSSYANEYNSAVPLHMTNTVRPPGSPWRTYMAHWEPAAWNMVDGKIARAFNLAILEVDSYIPSGQVLYCPSQIVPSMQWEPNEHKWALTPQERADQGVVLRVSYQYNPYKNGVDETRPYRLLGDFIRDNAVLALDILLNQEYAAHASRTGWNLL